MQRDFVIRITRSDVHGANLERAIIHLSDNVYRPREKEIACFWVYVHRNWIVVLTLRTSNAKLLNAGYTIPVDSCVYRQSVSCSTN